MTRRAAALAFLCFSLICPVWADDDAVHIIEKAFEAARANEAIAREFVFHERIEERRFTKNGAEKRRGSRTYDVTLLDSSEYRRLIAIDDKPLFASSAGREQRRLEKQIRKMQNETPRQRDKRLAKVEKNRRESDEFLEEITRAFDFRLTGEEAIGGVATYIVSAEPKPGYEPSRREGKVLAKLHGTLWISKDDHAWVKADMETLGAITWGPIFKLREGAMMRFTQRRLNDEVWLPDSWYVRLRTRVALVYKYNGEITGRYSNYRRFTSDSTAIYPDAAR